MKFISFAIDPGESSGWAIALTPDAANASGVARTPHERVAVCHLVAEYVEDTEYPLVVTAEKWNARGWRNVFYTALGLGRSFGRWLDHIELILGVKEQHFLRFHPNTWKHVIFTADELKGISREDHKRLVCQYTGVPEHDRADAMCMAMATHSTEEGLKAAESAVRRAKRARKKVV